MDLRPNANNNFSCPSPSSTQTHLQSPLPTSRSDPNSPFPTTFVTADPSSFKQVVQMLTGSPETSKRPTPPTIPTPTAAGNDSGHPHRNFIIPPIKTAPNKKQQQQSGFKLYERRNSLKHRLLMINPGQTAGASVRKPPEILSPSVLDFPALTLSPVTPLSAAGDDDQFDKSSHSSAEEERAIAEKGFYLHPSPMSTPRDAEPQLLPLFPVTSPRFSDHPSCSPAS